MTQYTEVEKVIQNYNVKRNKLNSKVVGKLLSTVKVKNGVITACEGAIAETQAVRLTAVDDSAEASKALEGIK